MALKDLYNDPASFKYNSKDNKYSKDIRGGGYSGQPWQKVSAPQTIDQLNSLTTEALSLDYPIRGGSYEELAARKDFARIDAFLQTYPQGKAFLDKQKGLLFTNPLMESGRSGGDSNTRLYSNGRNLMTQIAEGGTGFHHPNAGLEDELELFENKYEYVVSHKNTDQNRLVNLFKLKIKGESAGDLLFVNDASRLGINTVDQGELFFYSGGPGSLYGIGNTIIRRAQDSKGAPIITSNAPTFIGSNYKSGLYSSRVQARPATTIDYKLLLGPSKIFNLTQEQTGLTENNSSTLAQQTDAIYIRAEESATPTTNQSTPLFSSTMGYRTIINKTRYNGEVSDFRKNVIDPSTVNKSDYSRFNRTIRIVTGDPGRRQTFGTKEEKTNPSKEYILGQDKINMSDVGVYDASANRDIIKFAFETIDNNNPLNSEAMFFRAFLTGYSDNHNADWQSKRYTGRGENFYTYQGHDRQVSFNFKVAAQSKQEMKYIYRKLNFLLSTLYPDYNSAGFMRGNITKLTIGDLFVRTPGILTSLNLTVADEYAWEIAMNEPENSNNSDMLETPQIIDVAVSFIPILNTLPQKGKSSRILLTADPNNRYLPPTTTTNG